MAKQDRKAYPRVTPKRLSPKKIDRSKPAGRVSERITLDQLEETPERHRTRHEIQGILFGSLGIFLLVSLISYHYYAANPIALSGELVRRNLAGDVGAMISRLLFQYVGYIAYLFPVMTLVMAVDRFRAAPVFVSYGNSAAVILGIVCLCALLGLPFLDSIYAPGGILGAVLATLLKNYLNPFGSIVVIMTGILTASIMLKKSLIPPMAVPQHTIIETPEPSPTAAPTIVRQQPAAPPPAPKPPKKASKTFSERLGGPLKKKAEPSSNRIEAPAEEAVLGYQLPSTTLLNKPQTSKAHAGMEQELLKLSKVLEEKLLDFGIEGQVVGVLPGPVITRYEFQPAAGIKVSRIVNLADDLALAMKATAVRIVAPVPGKDVVGIEVPNAERETVYLRDLLEAKNFVTNPSRLALAVGKDIGGRPYIADLSKMPHLLIAGATGAGKSVCLNALICSMLFHATPDEVRFIMIDPKMLELGVYDGIPHLLIPVVKDPQKASNALNWATEEMTRRYGILAQKGVRNIAQYNDAIIEFRKTQHLDPLAAEAAETPLPYIVVIVDELADLMMVASGVEKPIARLAQMARAVGIHLILATQRPSVDVITGVIKANFPARIAFRVSSKVDSRTILDANGAELLLGNGDMLFLLPGTSNITRLHGAFLTEKEIKRLTTTLKKMGEPQYDQTVLDYREETPEEDDESNDLALYQQAVRLVVTNGEASVSLLRRALKIGHSRASRLIDLMERNGVVGSFQGPRPRDILVTSDELERLDKIR
jgi:DNA segregation ATPase FtsK/SpoIIIE, S-DNA-T family